MNKCPPCTGNCDQGRRCIASTPAEACTELGCDEPDFRAAANFWSLYLALLLVAVIAGVAVLAGCTAIPRMPF